MLDAVVRAGPTMQNRPETADETAEAVTARGGVGIHVRSDHTVDAFGTNKHN